MSAKRLRRSRGFTLVELMISLVMGVIISLAVVALARTATNTFHEQARVSTTEMALRAASERLRSDLLKVSYMSTGNIKLDPQIAHIPGGLNARLPALVDLQGIRVDVRAGLAATQGTMNLATLNNLAPDDIYIAGNLTSDDSYRGQWIGTGTCGGGGAQLRLNGLSDAAVGRMFNGATLAADIERNTKAVFMPGENMNPPVAAQYAVQVMDPRGCFHYVTVCKVAAGPQPNTVLLDLAGDGTNAILTPENTGGDVCGGRLMEEFAIAPVHRVRWYLAPGPSGDPRLYDPASEGTGQDKFNLYRQLLAADGTTPVGPPEIVSEYGVDLKFGIVVDAAPGTPAPNNIVVFDLDSDTGGGPISQWTEKSSLTVSGLPGPQKVRSVRYRLSVRTATPNQRADIPILPGTPYIVRYCMENAVPCRRLARVRSLVSEVALINQARMFY